MLLPAVAVYSSGDCAAVFVIIGNRSRRCRCCQKWLICKTLWTTCAHSVKIHHLSRSLQSKQSQRQYTMIYNLPHWNTKYVHYLQCAEEECFEGTI